MGRIVAICTSPERGTAKYPRDQAVLVKDWGIEGDAHGGNWHRQVSLLSYETVEAFRRESGLANAAKVEILPGVFGENLLISGFDFPTYPVGTKFRIGECLLEITQIGKECHSHCEIYRQVGHCIMPTKGVFARVLAGGEICVGQTVEETKEGTVGT